jgi:hypothetical protein
LLHDQLGQEPIFFHGETACISRKSKMGKEKVKEREQNKQERGTFLEVFIEVPQFKLDLISIAAQHFRYFSISFAFSMHSKNRSAFQEDGSGRNGETSWLSLT